MSETTGRVWQWGFHNVVTQNIGNLRDVIVGLDVTLTLLDYDLDMKQQLVFKCEFDAPEPSNFVEYEDLTPENLKQWAVSQHASEKFAWKRSQDEWIEEMKSKLISAIEARSQRSTRIIKATINE